jgi:hypothetical protein
MSAPVPYRNELAAERAMRRRHGGLPEYEKGGKQGIPSPGRGKRTVGNDDVDKMQHDWLHGTSEGTGVVGQRETRIRAPMAAQRRAVRIDGPRGEG